mmetsp:Transcript_5554/g.15982  ORF Transcript_5554/g.15982 Transcript_5554/m.15982 type:complete len:397 (-) Transcript_5554:402-1592(-)
MSLQRCDLPVCLVRLALARSGLPLIRRDLGLALLVLLVLVGLLRLEVVDHLGHEPLDRLQAVELDPDREPRQLQGTRAALPASPAGEGHEERRRLRPTALGRVGASATSALQLKEAHRLRQRVPCVVRGEDGNRLPDGGDLLRARRPSRRIVVRRGLATAPQVYQELLVRLESSPRRDDILLVLDQLLLHIGQGAGFLLHASLRDLNLRLLRGAEALEGDLRKDVLLLRLGEVLLHVLPHLLKDAKNRGASGVVGLRTGGGALHRLLTQAGEDASGARALGKAPHQVPQIPLHSRGEVRPMRSEGRNRGGDRAHPRCCASGTARALRRLRDQSLRLRHGLRGGLRLPTPSLQQAAAGSWLRQGRDGLLQQICRLNEVLLEGHKLLLGLRVQRRRLL